MSITAALHWRYATKRMNGTKIPNDKMDAILDSLKQVQDHIETQLKNSEAVNFNWSAKQTYIALGIGLVAAAEEKIDSTPMEGFDNVLLDGVLQLKEKGLKSTVIMALGYRDAENDYLVNLKKVRRPKDQLFIKLV